MNQALHIFKKDFRYLRYEICLVVVFAMAFAAAHLLSPHAFLSDSLLPGTVVHRGGGVGRTRGAGRGHPGRSPILDHAPLSLEKPAGSEASVRRRVRESAHFSG